MYTISGATPEIRQTLPDIEIKGTKATSVIGMEFLPNHADEEVMKLYEAKSHEPKKLLEIVKVKAAARGVEIIDIFSMIKRGPTCKCLARIQASDRDAFLKFRLEDIWSGSMVCDPLLQG